MKKRTIKFIWNFLVMIFFYYHAMTLNPEYWYQWIFYILYLFITIRIFAKLNNKYGI